MISPPLVEKFKTGNEKPNLLLCRSSIVWSIFLSFFSQTLLLPDNCLDWFRQFAVDFKGPLLCLRQFLTIESFSKMMTNTFYFMLKFLFVVEIFKLLYWLFGYVGKPLDQKTMVNSKIYDFTGWTTNNQNTQITQYLKN